MSAYTCTANTSPEPTPPCITVGGWQRGYLLPAGGWQRGLLTPCSQAMTNPIARCPGLVKCDHIYIRASKFPDKNTICIIRGLVTFWVPNFGLVHFKIICQALAPTPFACCSRPICSLLRPLLTCECSLLPGPVLPAPGGYAPSRGPSPVLPPPCHPPVLQQYSARCMSTEAFVHRRTRLFTLHTAHKHVYCTHAPPH
jgi:hypothetical protein